MPSWAIVLHFYQPPTQSLSLTEEILRSCYLPLCDLLLSTPDIKITINLSGSLLLQTQLIPNHDFAAKIEQLQKSGKVLFLNSPIYHPIIPLTPPEVIDRQLSENKQVINNLCHFEPSAGLFPPELAIDLPSLERFGQNADFVFIDESSVNPNFDLNNIPESPVYRSASLPVNLITASRSISELIRSYPTELHAEPLTKFIYRNMNVAGGSETDPLSVTQSGERNTSYASSAVAHLKGGRAARTRNQILVTMSDAEVFGHHYRERLNLLRELFDQRRFQFITLSELLNSKFEIRNSKFSLTASSWQTSTSDLKNNNPFPLWKTPGNKLQEKYYQLAQTAYQKLAEAEKQTSEMNTETIPSHVLHSAQHHFDQGTSSCHTYWLSQIPWWHPDLVEAGAKQLIKCIRTLPDGANFKREAETFYHQFLMDLWHHHWSGKVEKAYIEYDHQRPQLLKGLPKI